MNIYDINGNIIPVGQANKATDNGCDNTGTKDTSSRIQDYIRNNRFCYFPEGTYIIKEIIYIPSNTVIFCEKGTIFKRMANINAMFTSDGDSTIAGYDGVHDILVYGAEFNQNGNTYTTQCTELSFIHAQRVYIEKCVFTGHKGGWHCIELSACKYCEIKDCYFDGANVTTEAVQIESPYDSTAWPWSNGAIDDSPAMFCDVSNCVFAGGAVGVGNHGSGRAQYTNIQDCTFNGQTEYAVRFYGGTANYVHDNIALDCAHFVYTACTVAHSNVIDGTYTA